MKKARGKVVPKGKTTSNMKVMDGIKQKPEKKDMHKPLKMSTPSKLSNR